MPRGMDRPGGNIAHAELGTVSKQVVELATVGGKAGAPPWWWKAVMPWARSA